MNGTIRYIQNRILYWLRLFSNIYGCYVGEGANALRRLERATTILCEPIEYSNDEYRKCSNDKSKRMLIKVFYDNGYSMQSLLWLAYLVGSLCSPSYHIERVLLNMIYLFI